MIKVAPSILSADFSKLGCDIVALEEGGADIIHIDVMDGMFVPNISFGIPIIKSIRKYTTLPFDVHLMIEQPSRYIENFVKAGADIITVHYEADRHIDRTISLIKSYGIKAGIALNPATPTGLIKHILDKLDMVLVMTVNPGFGGQKYIDYCSQKVKEIRLMSEVTKPDLFIEVDGGIDVSNIKEVAECGANVIVAGSSIFKEEKIRENIEMLRKAVL
jgi:ribulose-phosphate 3-epimerase